MMKRRTCLKAMMAVVGGAVVPMSAGGQPMEGRPIQLHADLAVDPVREEEMLSFFAQNFVLLPHSNPVSSIAVC